MLAHRLRHRIEIQQLVEDQDSETGATVFSWVTVMLNNVTLNNVPAEVLTGPGREFSEAGATQAETSARINIRWFPGLLPTWRILWDGKTYNITSIETDITSRQEYRLRCIDGLTDGR